MIKSTISYQDIRICIIMCLEFYCYMYNVSLVVLRLLRRVNYIGTFNIEWQLANLKYMLHTLCMMHYVMTYHKFKCSTHTHARTHACTHARTHTHTHSRTHTCTHARTHAHTHTHTHTHTNTQSNTDNSVKVYI